MGFRHHKQKNDLNEHFEKEYRRITDMAKKSPRAGFAHMGRALNKYYGANKKYPEDLMSLYPEFMPSKTLIEEIDWVYRPGTDNFYLSKTVVRNNRQLVASIDKNLKTTIAADTVMLASRKGSSGEGGEDGDSDEGGTWVAIIDQEGLSSQPIVIELTPPTIPQETGRETLGQQRRIDNRKLIITDAESRENRLEKKASRKYLVWKDAQGNIGISNVEYPNQKHKIIFRDGKWYDVKDSNLKIAIRSGSGEDQSADSTDMDLVSNRGRYLTWKAPDGSLGIGNVQYPDTDQQVVFRQGKWEKMDRPAIKTPLPIPSFDQIGKQDQSQDAGLATLSRRNLTWKRSDGSIGFGNVAYPIASDFKIYTREGWMRMKASLKPEPAPAITDEQYGPRNKDEIASKFGRKHLIWKSKTGELGFGNVQYPDKEAVDGVHSGDHWDRLPE